MYIRLARRDVLTTRVRRWRIKKKSKRSYDYGKIERARRGELIRSGGWKIDALLIGFNVVNGIIEWLV